MLTSELLTDHKMIISTKQTKENNSNAGLMRKGLHFYFVWKVK